MRRDEESLPQRRNVKSEKAHEKIILSLNPQGDANQSNNEIISHYRGWHTLKIKLTSADMDTGRNRLSFSADKYVNQFSLPGKPCGHSSKKVLRINPATPQLGIYATRAQKQKGENAFRPLTSRQHYSLNSQQPKSGSQVSVQEQMTGRSYGTYIMDNYLAIKKKMKSYILLLLGGI